MSCIESFRRDRGESQLRYSWWVQSCTTFQLFFNFAAFCFISRLRFVELTKMEKCATSGGRNSKLKLKKHALPAIEAILTQVTYLGITTPSQET